MFQINKIPVNSNLMGRWRFALLSVPWDRFGFIASSLCALHCICLPWLLIALPILSRSLIADPRAERFFVVGSVLLALTCSLLGLRKFASWTPLLLVLGGSGVLLFVHATAPPSCCAREIEWTQALDSAFGGGLLATSHFFGLRLRSVGKDIPACGNQDCQCVDDAGGVGDSGQDQRRG